MPLIRNSDAEEACARAVYDFECHMKKEPCPAWEELSPVARREVEMKVWQIEDTLERLGFTITPATESD